MRKVLPLFVMAALLVAAAPKDKGGKKDIHKDWPTANQIEKAAAKVSYDKDKEISHRNAKKEKITFTPADIGHMNDEERGKGCIIGKLDTDRNTGDGLTPGQYRVYMRKHEGKWQVFFCQKDEAVENSKSVVVIQDNEHDPKFLEAGTRIRYWYISFSL